MNSLYKKVESKFKNVNIPLFRNACIGIFKNNLKLESRLDAEHLFYLNPFFSKFRVILFGHHSYGYRTIINQNSQTNHVFVNTRISRINIILDNEDIIKKYCNSSSILFYGGDDKKIPNRFLEENKSSFRKILVETLTENASFGCLTFPSIGNLRYFLNGNIKCFNKFLDNSNIPKKTNLVCGASGYYYKNIDEAVTDRSNLNKFSTDNNKFIQNIFCEPKKYLTNKAKYKFFMCPRGRGIQANKIWESLICNTIPVMTDHPNIRQLKEIYKIPIHIVNDWNEITEENLNEVFEKEYKNYDWELLKKKFLIDNFFNWIESSIDEQESGDVKCKSI